MEVYIRIMLKYSAIFNLWFMQQVLLRTGFLCAKITPPPIYNALIYSCLGRFYSYLVNLCVCLEPALCVGFFVVCLRELFSRRLYVFEYK